MLTLHGPAGTATTHTGYKISFGVWMVRIEEDGNLSEWHALFVSRNPMLQDQLCDLTFHESPGGVTLLSGQAFVWKGDPRSDRNRCEATDRLVIHTANYPSLYESDLRQSIPEEMRHEENGIVLRMLFPDPANPLHIEWDITSEDDLD